ncbi:hypothetical protein ABHV46_11300 [Asaia sp. BMEF1]
MEHFPNKMFGAIQRPDHETVFYVTKEIFTFSGADLSAGSAI